MYYLLKNKIINDEEKDVFFQTQDTINFLSIDNCNFYQVLDSSENLYDLIKVGDLIKDNGCIYEVSDITYKGYTDNRRSFVSQPADFKHHEWDITVIYKPNSKGDYIKVWEHEE